MIAIWSLLLSLPFFIPAHFYPIPTYLEELCAAVLSVIFGAYALVYRPKEFFYGRLHFLWLLIGFVWMASWFANTGDIVSAGYFHLYIWFAGLFALIGGAGCIEKYGYDRFIDVSARVLVFSGFLYACLGLFSFYGFLKYLIPWVGSDNPRLVGIMAHPNLSAVYLTISLSAFFYLTLRDQRRLWSPLALIFLVVVSVASVMTGSRAFFLILLVQLIVVMVFFLPTVKRSGLGPIKKVIAFPLLVIFMSIGVAFLYPPIDRSIVSHLTGVEFLKRDESAGTLIGRYTSKGQPRLGEWRKIISAYSIIDNKVLGVGPGGYSQFSVEADAVIDDPYRNGRTWRNAHNIFLMSLVEWGWLGLLAVIVSIGILSNLFFRCEKSYRNLFSWLVISSIFAHNLVEFSLWHLQFLVVFLVFLGAQFRQRVVFLSSVSLAWASVIPVLLLTLWISVSATKDYLNMAYLITKKDLNDSDVQTLDVIAQDPLWRPYSRLIMYYRMNPFSTGLEGQLSEVEKLASWSPLNLVLMRQASLTAGIGQDELACERIHRATELYPTIAETLMTEIEYLKDSGVDIDLEYLSGCFSNK